MFSAKIRLLALILLALAALLIISCENDDDGDDGGDDDDDDDDDNDDNGPPCPNGPYDCDWDQGCHEEVCGKCTKAGECHNMEGCLPDGSCGPCTDSDQCEGNEVCRHGFCLKEVIPLWELTMTEDDWETMIADLGTDTYYPCALMANGENYNQDVECRLYGVSSRLYPKKGIRIKFPEDAEHPGYTRKINLKADYNEPTLMRSLIAHESFRRLTKIPSSKARYIRLNVNGAYYGLMVELERIGGKFLERRGRNRDNSMYETEELNDYGAMIPLEDLAEYNIYYAKKTGENEEDFSDLIELIENQIWKDYLDSGTSGPTSVTRIEDSIDLELKVQYLAVMAILQENDHVTADFHFSWQEDAAGGLRWEFYPWDLNMSLGCIFDEELWDVFCNEPRADDWWKSGVFPDGANVGTEQYWANLLIHLVLNNPELYEVYVQTICSMLDSDYWTNRLPNLVEGLSETIWDAVAADENDRNQTMDDFINQKEGLLWFIEQRRLYLKTQLDCPS